MSTTPKPPQIIPYLFYRDVPAALDFLCRAFGFKEEMRIGTPSGGMHGEASFQGQLVMMGQGAHERNLTPPKQAGAATVGVFITRPPGRRARKSFIRQRTNPTAEPTGRSIPKGIPGSSRRRRRRGEPRRPQGIEAPTPSGRGADPKSMPTFYKACPLPFLAFSVG